MEHNPLNQRFLLPPFCHCHLGAKFTKFKRILQPAPTVAIKMKSFAWTRFRNGSTSGWTIGAGASTGMISHGRSMVAENSTICIMMTTWSAMGLSLLINGPGVVRQLSTFRVSVSRQLLKHIIKRAIHRSERRASGLLQILNLAIRKSFITLKDVTRKKDSLQE